MPPLATPAARAGGPFGGRAPAQAPPPLPGPHPCKRRRLMKAAAAAPAGGGAGAPPPHSPPAGAAAPAAAATVLLDGLSQLPLGRYRAVLLDQFGVLHDGNAPYPGAAEALAHLRAAGLQLLVLSNSSRRATHALDNLTKMGFDVAGVHAVTSGEVTHGALAARRGAFWGGLRRPLHITWAARGAISLEGLGLHGVADGPDDADFVLAHGTEAVGRALDGAGARPASLDELRALLRAAAARGLPLVCSNPDVVTVKGDALVPMPGTLARWYREMGGEVRLMGKPAAAIYGAAARLLGGVRASEMLAIGDSAEHDVAGAAAAGVDCCFVGGGIHRDAVLEGGGGGGGAARWRLAGLAALWAEHGVAPPAFALPSFRL